MQNSRLRRHKNVTVLRRQHLTYLTISGFGVGGSVVFDNQGQEQIAGRNQIKCIPESAAVIS